MRAFGVGKVVSFYLALLGVAALGLGLKGGGFNCVLPGASLGEWTISLALGLSSGLLVVLVSRFMVARLEWARRLAEEFRAIFGELTGGQALMLALASAWGEEVLFRGVLQPVLGLWLGALVFGLLHIGPNARFLPWTVMACAAGLLFGWLFLYTGTLLAPIVAHATINYLNLRAISARHENLELHLEPVGGESAVGGA